MPKAIVVVHLERYYEGIECNEERANMVKPLVEAFGSTYYSRGFSGWRCESFETILSDFIADLGHMIDRLPEDEWDEPGAKPTFESVLERARYHYEAEVAEEQEEWDDESSTDT